MKTPASADAAFRPTAWKSAYRRIPAASPADTPEMAAFENARTHYRRLCRRVARVAGSSLGVAISLFCLTFFALGRKSTELPLLAPAAIATAAEAASPPSLETSETEARLAALEEENIRLKLEMYHRQEANRQAYTLVRTWIESGATTGAPAPAPAALREALGLPAESADPALVARIPR